MPVSSGPSDPNQQAFRQGQSVELLAAEMGAALADLGRSDLSARVTWVSATGSTNADLAALGSEARGTVVRLAESQTSGRGRLGRSWEATPGASLLMSVGIDVPREVAAWSTAAMALAALESTRALGAPVALKWPNDLLANEVGQAGPATTRPDVDPNGESNQPKVAGILAEVVGPVAGGLRVVVGIGVNVAAGSVPPGLDRPAATLEDLGVPAVQRPALAAQIVVAFDGRVRLLRSSFGDVVAEYRDRLDTLGRRVRVELASQEMVEGTAMDVTMSGELVVSTISGERRIGAGDVVHLR